MPRTSPPSIAQRIAAARLEGQFLLDTPHTSPADVVRALVAVQSQDYFGGKWAIGMRAAGLTDAAIDDAHDRGEILRTHVLRPTWHFVAPEDLAWMLTLTGPRIAKILSSYNSRLGIDAAVIRKSHRMIEKALAKHGHLTRAELKESLNSAGIDTAGTQRLAHLVMQAEVDGIVCSGARKGKNSTYALVSERAPRPRLLSRDESLGELALRYFATRAPASVHDFSWWSGLTIGDSRRAVEIAGRKLEPLTLDDKNYFVPSDFELPTRIPTVAHLLPNYDEFFIGLRDRSAIGERMKSHALVTGGTSLIAHIVEINGQIVGGWKRLISGTALELRFDIPMKLTRTERALVVEQVKRVETFLGVRADVAGLP